MKRTLIALATVILLSGCGTKKTDYNNEQEKNAVQQTPFDEIEDNENNSLQEKENSVFYIHGELPDIGEFSGIGVDNSFYNERFFEHPVHEFVTDEDYGKIIPYVVDYKEFFLDGRDVVRKFPVYGFCNTEGKIITDELYNVDHIWNVKTSDGFEYYNITRLIDSEYGECGYGFENLFVSADGKWFSNGWPNKINGGYVIFKNDNKYDVYNYEGEFVSNIENVEIYALYDNGTLSVYNRETAEYDLIDVYGNVIEIDIDINLKYNKYGISAYEYGGVCGLLTKSGYIINSDNYNFVKYYESADALCGAFIAQLKSNPHLLDVYSMDGNVLCRIDTGERYYYDVKFTSDNEIVLITKEYSDGEAEVRIIPQSDVLKSNDLNINLEVLTDEFHARAALPYFLAEDKENDRVLICDRSGNTVFSEDSGFYKDSCCLLQDKKSVSYLNEYGINIVDIETGQKFVFENNNANYYEFAGEDDRFLLVYEMSEDAICSMVYDFRNKIELFSLESCDYIEIINDDSEDFYISVCSGGISTLYDKNLNTLLEINNNLA